MAVLKTVRTDTMKYNPQLIAERLERIIGIPAKDAELIAGGLACGSTYMSQDIVLKPLGNNMIEVSVPEEFVAFLEQPTTEEKVLSAISVAIAETSGDAEVVEFMKAAKALIKRGGLPLYRETVDRMFGDVLSIKIPDFIVNRNKQRVPAEHQNTGIIFTMIGK